MKIMPTLEPDGSVTINFAPEGKPPDREALERLWGIVNRGGKVRVSIIHEDGMALFLERNGYPPCSDHEGGGA